MTLVIDDEVSADVVRIARIQNMLRKFAVTVSGSAIDLRIVTERHLQPAGQPPAWSDGNCINLYHDTETDIMDVDSLVRLKGLTIHELGHVLFTPRDRTDLAKRVQQNGLWNAFNILEDNRIDNMMVARLSGVAPWLLHTVLHEFFNAPNADHSHLLPLLHGRHYVPKKIRDLSATVYVYQDHVADIQRIIDEYIKLNMARKEHQSRAYELCAELTKLLSSNDKSQHPQDYAVTPAKNGGTDMTGVREQDDALDRASKQAAQAPEPDDTPAPTSYSEAKEQLHDELEQAGQQVEEDIYEDIKTMVRSMRGGSGAAGSNSADRKVKHAEHSWMREVAPEMQVEARSFARVLSELKTLFDPSWVSRQSEGRLNPREFLMGASYDESFDLWDDGKSEVSDIESVILLDISGSMYHNLTQAYDSMWAIKRALDSINASTTVLTFGDYSRILYDANSRVALTRKHSYDGSGGTAPLDGLAFARNRLFSSSRAIKLLTVITDGAWFDKSASDAIIAEMRHSGVLTGLVYLADNSLEELRSSEREFKVDGHGCEVVTVLDKPTDITKFARQLVERQQQLLINS